MQEQAQALNICFSGYKWVVQYSAALTSYDWQSNYIDSVALTNYPTLVHDETSPNHLDNWELAPTSNILYGGSVISQATGTYGNAEIMYENNILGSTPNGNGYGAWFFSESNGAEAWETVQLTGDSNGAYGDIWIYAQTSWSYDIGANLVVYASADAQNWYTVNSMTIQPFTSPQWMNIGFPMANGEPLQYQYVMFVVYSNSNWNHESAIGISCVSTPYYNGINLIDSFRDTAINTNLWTWLQLNGGLTWEQGSLIVNSQGNQGWGQMGVVSNQAYEMNEHSVTVGVSSNYYGGLDQMNLMIDNTQTTTSDPYFDSNWYRIGIDNYCNGNYQSIVIEEKINGEYSLVYANSWSSALGSLTISISDGAINFYLDGSNIYSETCNLPSTQCYFYVYSSSQDAGQGSFNDFSYG